MDDSAVIILPTAPEAARRVTVEGWVDRHGRFWGDGRDAERMARHNGATHLPCDGCGRPIPIPGYTRCGPCREVAAIARYATLERCPWDGVAMVYSGAKDRFYNSPDEALDDREEGETPEQLRLVLGEPQYCRRIDLGDFADDFPTDDHDNYPAALDDAIAAFNAVVEALPPLSWAPGSYAVDLTGVGEGI